MSAFEQFHKSNSYAARRTGFIGGLAQRIQRYRTYQRTLGELEALGDRELEDMNMSRAMLRGIAYRAAYNA